jgi:hypothetical protein
MHYGVHAMGAQDFEYRFPVADLADHEGRVEDRLPEASREIIQDHDPLAPRAQLEYDVAADVARPAGY